MHVVDERLDAAFAILAGALDRTNGITEFAFDD